MCVTLCTKVGCLVCRARPLSLFFPACIVSLLCCARPQQKPHAPCVCGQPNMRVDVRASVNPCARCLVNCVNLALDSSKHLGECIFMCVCVSGVSADVGGAVLSNIQCVHSCNSWVLDVCFPDVAAANNMGAVVAKEEVWGVAADLFSTPFQIQTCACFLPCRLCGCQQRGSSGS